VPGQVGALREVVAVVELRRQTEGRAYFDRKKAAGKTSMEAIRCLKRRLSDIVYRQLLDDALRALAAGPEGHSGTTLQSSAADSHPVIDSSDKPQTGPASAKPRTATLAES
jgi:transposase